VRRPREINFRNYSESFAMKQVCKKSVFIPAVVALAVLAVTPSVGRADGLIANWTLNAPTGTTSIPDASGNGHTATLLGTDTLTSMSDMGYPSAPVGGGLNFSGLAGTGNCLSVPYSASFGGMTTLTLSAWVYYPTGTDYTNAVPVQTNRGQELFNLWDQDGGNQSFKWGYYLDEPSSRPGFTDVAGLTGGQSSVEAWTSCWKTVGGLGPDYTAGTWAQWTMVFNGNAQSNGYDGGQTAVSTCFIYENGVLMTGGSFNIGWDGMQFALNSPALGQALEIAGATNEWYGSLADLGMWNVALTSPNFAGTSPGGVAGNTRGSSGGEVAALYNTPMYNNNTGPLSQYGVKAMDQLFTLFDGADPGTVAVVTANNSTLAWRYVAGALTLGSGAAGQPVAGQYAVQFDNAGDGVETVLFGDANLDGQVDINDLTVVLAHYNQSGMTWTQGEFTGSGTVDINDLTIVLAHYNQSFGSAGGIAAVPEPSVLLLFAAGLAGLLAHAWRKRK
jgi:hypothetical protein